MPWSILVAGGAGYIGSHMVRMLMDAGHRVTAFDNLSRGHRDAVGQAELIQGDLRSTDDLRRCFAGRDYDLVMHFAALAYVGESVQHPARYYDNNVKGTLNLLEAMQVYQVRRLVFSSTCATYGEPRERPITEDHPQQPVNPYGRTKLIVEQALKDYTQAYGLASISLRYFNAAGCDPAGRLGERHEPETHLIPLVLREAARVAEGGDPGETRLAVFGDDFDTPDGTCVRDYIHVTDLCSAHLQAAGRLMEGGTEGAEAYNLGNGAGCSVRQAIDICRRVTGIDIRYRLAPRRPGDPAWLIGSAARARAVLGWQPAMPALEDIIRTAWTWMRGRKAGVEPSAAEPQAPDPGPRS
jgi:UDP-glucose-4-epimerase GalE